MMTAGGPGSGPGAAKVDEGRGAKYWKSVLHGTLRSMDAREWRESERDRRSFRRARSRYLCRVFRVSRIDVPAYFLGTIDYQLKFIHKILTSKNYYRQSI